MKIYLIGMPGSGKTTIGQSLAEKLSLPFIDLDVEIELKEGKSIKEIFNESGEDYFRQIESQCLINLSASNNDFVVATGGGAPCFYNGIEIINKSGLSIFLDVGIQELVKRISHSSLRPLLQTSQEDEMKKKLNALREKRLPIYQQAAITISNPDVTKVVESLNHFNKK